MFGFNLSKPTKEDISFIIEEKFDKEILTGKIEATPINKVGVKIDEVITTTKDKLFEKLMQVIG